MSGTQVISQMAVLTLLMAVGFVCCKCGVLSESANQKISRLVLNVMCPGVILDSVLNQTGNRPVRTVLLCMAAAAAFYALFGLLFRAVFRLLKLPGKKSGAYESMLLFSNVGFMGIPVVQAFFGAGAVFYLSIFIFVFNVVIFTYGKFLVSGGEGGFSWRSAVNAPVVGSVLGMALFFLKLKPPQPVCDAVGLIGATVTPLAMIVIGSNLALTPLRSVFTEKGLYLLTAVKLLALPTLVWLLFGLFLKDPVVLGISVITAGMPVAGNLVMLSNDGGGESALLAKGSFLTTALSVLTIPVITGMIAG